jgi:hypothetical protein
MSGVSSILQKGEEDKGEKREEKTKKRDYH